MAGSLHGPPFKTPSYCIRKSARNYRQELLDLQCNHSNPQHQQQQHRRRQFHQQQQQHYLRRPHFQLELHQHDYPNHQNRKKLLAAQQEQRKRKQVNHFQTFYKLSNGCIPRLNGCDSNVTDAAAISTKATEYVLEPNLQITSSRFKSLASDDTISLVNHSQLSSSTFCVLPKSIE